MSVDLVVTLPTFAFYAADTRHTLKTIFGKVVGFQDGGRKFHALRGGWIGGGTDCVDSTWAAEHLLGWNPVNETTVPRRLSEIIPIQDDFCRLRVVQHGPRGFDLYMIELVERKIYRKAGGGFAADGCYPSLGYDNNTPENLATLDEIARQTCELTKSIFESLCLEGLPACLRATARHFFEVYRLCGPEGTVSPTMGFGLLIKKPYGVQQMEIRPTLAAELAEATDADLTVWMRPALTPQLLKRARP